MKQPADRRNREPEMMVAALEIFASKGYAASSVQDVADAIGVLKGSLYHYINTKEDLLFKLLDNAHAENDALMTEVTALEIGPAERLRTYLHKSIEKTLRNVDLTTLYFREWRSLTGERHHQIVERRKDYDRFLRRLISAALEAEGLAAGAADVARVSAFVGAGTNWIADSYVVHGHSVDRDVTAYTRIAMAAILGSAELRTGGDQASTKATPESPA